VHAIYEDDPVGGDIVVVRSGGVHVIIPSRRKPYHRIQEFWNVDLDPADHDITVVKIGYLEPELRDAASLSFIALTPGAVDQDIPNLPFHRVARPVFPLDPDMADPHFDVRLFGPIG
jgi:microcystin degradation protein MlrC